MLGFPKLVVITELINVVTNANSDTLGMGCRPSTCQSTCQSICDLCDVPHRDLRNEDFDSIVAANEEN